MQAIEFEATKFQHTIRIPDHIPEGVAVRVLLLLDEPAKPTSEPNEAWKSLLAAMPDVGEDADFSRSIYFGKEYS